MAASGMMMMKMMMNGTSSLPQINGGINPMASPVMKKKKKMMSLIMVTSTSLMLFAGRFGLAPSANRRANASLRLERWESGLQTGDPAGFTLADTLACGSLGHIIGVGVVLGLKNMGVI